MSNPIEDAARAFLANTPIGGPQALPGGGEDLFRAADDEIRKHVGLED